jgi:hypothetical protein
MNKLVKDHMIDAIITLETAKLLKEKKFHIWVTGSYTEYLKTQKDLEYPEGGGPFGWEKGEINFDSRNYFCNDHNSDYSNKKYKMYAAPTLSFVQTWLREEHNILVFANYRQFAIEECDGWYWHIGKSVNQYNSDQYVSYETALEAGLQEGLRQIKI